MIILASPSVQPVFKDLILCLLLLFLCTLLC
uniref:Uncharacterized protein n=1 Tax=Arundo donax TaxID=35708 RepID=A0A0A9HFY7_ARUDO